jgi:hypothetical protein
MALKFKAGYRRVNDSSHPSTYQANYRYKDPDRDVPLIDATCKVRETGWPSRVVVTAEQHHPPAACPVHHYPEQAPMAPGKARTYGGPADMKENRRPGTVGPKHRRTPVEPLALPDSDSRVAEQNKQVRTRDTAGGEDISASLPLKQKREASSPPKAEGVKKKKKEFSSPLKRLYESDHQRRGLAKAVFQTQYQMQYKDKTVGAAGKEGRAKIKQGRGG